MPAEYRLDAHHVLPRRGVAVAAMSVIIVAGLSLYFACRYQDDFRVYVAGAQHLADGTLYRSWTRGDLFTYPPFAALVFVPLGRIPSPIAAQIVWALLNDAALTALIGCSIRAVRPGLPRRSRLLWASGLAAPAFFLDPVLLSIRHGQVNLLLATLVVWDLAGSRRIGAATVPRGVATGVAAAIKLTPLIFLPYLVLTRRPRAAGNCAAAFALCEGIAFALAPGSSAAYWTRYVFDYTRVGGHLGLGGLLATSNQNLMGALARFNHATVPTGALWAMTVLIGAAGLLLAALLHSRCSAFLGVVVCATTGLVISPVTWTHHMVWILPAIAWLAAAPERPRWGPAMAAATAVLFWAAPIWWVPNGTNGSLRPLHEYNWQLFAGNSFFLWMVLFLAATAVIAASALWRTPTAAWRRRVTSLSPGYRHSVMREKLTAAAITSLSRWTPYLEREMSGLRALVRPGSVCIDVGHAARYRRSPDDVTGWLLERGYTMHTWRRGWRPAGHIHPGTRNYLFRPPASEPGAPRLVSDQRKLRTA